MDEFSVPKYGIIERSWKDRLRRKRWVKPKENNEVPNAIVWLKGSQSGDKKYVFDRIVLKCHGKRQILLLTYNSTTWAIEDRNEKRQFVLSRTARPLTQAKMKPSDL